MEPLYFCRDECPDQLALAVRLLSATCAASQSVVVRFFAERADHRAGNASDRGVVQLYYFLRVLGSFYHYLRLSLSTAQFVTAVVEQYLCSIKRGKSRICCG